MRTIRLALSALAAVAMMGGAVRAACAEADWQKTYAVKGKPSLTLSIGDSALEMRSCGSCSEVRIRVEWNDRRSSDYSVTEFESGDSVNFTLKERLSLGFHMNMGTHQGPRVLVESPSATDVDARSVDGSLTVSGVQGTLQLHTSDGALNVSDVSGALRLTASDGAIHVHNAAGTIESRSSDGSVNIEGRFTGVHVHTSDGALDLTLADGSQLTTTSRIESGDGSVKIHLPRTLAADLDVHTGDGHVDCRVPITMNGYNSSGDSKHEFRGRMNGGGTSLTIHTGDGSVTIDQL